MWITHNTVSKISSIAISMSVCEIIDSFDSIMGLKVSKVYLTSSESNDLPAPSAEKIIQLVPTDWFSVSAGVNQGDNLSLNVIQYVPEQPCYWH